MSCEAGPGGLLFAIAALQHGLFMPLPFQKQEVFVQCTKNVIHPPLRRPLRLGNALNPLHPCVGDWTDHDADL